MSRRLGIVVAVCLVAGGCANQQVPATAPTTIETTSSAIDLKRANVLGIESAHSSTPATVTSAELTTFGKVMEGSGAAPATLPVWAVTVAGTFRPPSCGPAVQTGTQPPCPSPASTMLVILDAATGTWIASEAPAP